MIEWSEILRNFLGFHRYPGFHHFHHFHHFHRRYSMSFATFL